MLIDWIARARFSQRSVCRTDKTDEKGVSSVSSVGVTGILKKCGPASAATTASGSDAWTDDEIARFTDRRARLARWGWSEAEAENMAERLVMRDRGPDDRVVCVDCLHFRPGRCDNHQQAGLSTAEVARGLANLLQRCPGHKPRK